LRVIGGFFMSEQFCIEPDLNVMKNSIIHNPDDAFYIQYLKPYYIITKDGQYLFGSTQLGRRPDRVFYMVPNDHKLGKKQKKFDNNIGKKIYEVITHYLVEEKPPLIIQDGIQGESGYEISLRTIVSIRNPHTAYIAWMGKMMVFPPKKQMNIDCLNYVIQEKLPMSYTKELQELWSEYDPNIPLTIYDFTEMKKNIRRVLNLHVDYFGSAFKKPNLTMVWNKAEADGLISYHAGCTSNRVLKGLSGTGKTTLTVGPNLEQDDACVGKPTYNKNGKITAVHLIGLEAASFAKSEGITHTSPEYPGLMKSREQNTDGSRPIVLAMNIDCEGVHYVKKEINGYTVNIPEINPNEKAGSLQCTSYQKSGTTNGRFIFLFSELNPHWGHTKKKFIETEALSYKKFDILEPIFRVIDPKMAVALDSSCESIITSAIAAQKPGTRVRSYAATDFMAREQSQQAIMKLKMYTDLGLDLKEKLVFFISNAGFVGEYDLEGKQRKKQDEAGNYVPKQNKETGEISRNEIGEIVYKGLGEKIPVADSKQLIDLVEHKKIRHWIKHPVFGYLIPQPSELEQEYGMKNFGKRYNPLNYYTAKEYLAFIERDKRERTQFLEELFKGQTGEDQLREVIYLWSSFTLPSEHEIIEFYHKYYDSD